MKIFLFALVFIICTGFVYAQSFNDISGHQNETAIDYLSDKGIINGYKDGSFKPDKKINRAELVKIFSYKLINEPDEDPLLNCFSDVSGEWFAPYVCYAKKKGWVEGYPDNKFYPEKEVNIVEAIKILVESQGYPVPEAVVEQQYEDVKNIEWYAPYVMIAKYKGILDKNNSYLGIADFISRGEASELIYRALIMEEEGYTNYYDFIQAGPFKVVGIDDGDTIFIDMDGEEKIVRLIGIDTPEVDSPFYSEAKNTLKAMLLNKDVLLEKDLSETDQLNRLLRYVYIGDIFVNLELLKLGYAKVSTYPPDIQYYEEFRAAEDLAKKQKRGMWNSISSF